MKTTPAHAPPASDDDDQEIPPPSDGAIPSYLSTPSGLVWLKPTRDGGKVSVQLTNFTARIVADVEEDDGHNAAQHQFEIEATYRGHSRSFMVPVNQYSSLEWATRQLGSRALVYPGQALKDHARAAIQLTSPDHPRRQVCRHAGWRSGADGDWMYLRRGGAIGPETWARWARQIGWPAQESTATATFSPDGDRAIGPVGPETSTMTVLLGKALSKVDLPVNPHLPTLVGGVRASLDLLALAPDKIMVPLLGAVYRAALCEAHPTDLSIHLSGPSGAFKSELAALAQQHFGAGFDRLHLPAGWSATDNALERLAFDAKDAVVVIDDFAPTGTAMDVARLHAKADRVLRGIGNGAGRQRMNADGSLRADFPPRGLVISTGEDVPKGKSLRARLQILEVGPGDVDTERLTGAQASGREGLLASAMAGYVAWLSPQLEAVRHRLPVQVARLGNLAVRQRVHRRTPEGVANLAAGRGWFLCFAYDIEAITAKERKSLEQRVWSALGEMAASQADHRNEQDPVQQFFDHLNAALVSGRAHLENMGPNPAILFASRGGAKVGWVECDDVYLEPTAAYACVKELADRGGGTLPNSLQTIEKRLHEQGKLASVDTRGGETRLRVRKTLDGVRRAVLHLHRDTLLCEDPAQPAQPAQLLPALPGGGGAGGAENGPEAHQAPAHGSGPIRLLTQDEEPFVATCRYCQRMTVTLDLPGGRAYRCPEHRVWEGTPPVKPAWNLEAMACVRFGCPGMMHPVDEPEDGLWSFECSHCGAAEWLPVGAILDPQAHEWAVPADDTTCDRCDEYGAPVSLLPFGPHRWYLCRSCGIPYQASVEWVVGHDEEEGTA
jgi:hypothetical protein